MDDQDWNAKPTDVTESVTEPKKSDEVGITVTWTKSFRIPMADDVTELLEEFSE